MLRYASSRMFFLTFLTLFLAGPLAAKDASELPIGINEKLGEIVDLNYRFVDSHGDSVTVGELVERPTIINFVYFSCPGICSPLLEGLQTAVELVDLEAGVDFRVVTISIKDDETAEDAARRKKDFMQRFHKQKMDEQDWIWLTGDSANIKGLTDATGFAFKRTGDDFAHPGVIMVVDREGRMCRYLYGTSFNPFNLKMAVLEASQSKWGPSMASVAKFCFSYDPNGRGYVLNFKRIFASLVLLGMLGFVFVITRKGKSKQPVER